MVVICFNIQCITEKTTEVVASNVHNANAAVDGRRSPKKKKKKKKKKKVIRQPVVELDRQESVHTSAVQVPTVSNGSGEPRPGPIGNDPALNTLKCFERERRMGSRDYAVRCLTLAQRFNERPWLQQVRQAVAMATIGVKRVYSRQPHLFSAADDAVI